MLRPLALAIALGLLCPAAYAQSDQPCPPPAPPAVAPGANIFSEQQEADLGDAVAEHVARDYPVVEDPAVAGYLERIGARLAAHLPQTSLRYRFLLVDVPDANAFSLPGGRVYVTRKLVAQARSEDELAGVVAHELGHAVSRHPAVEMTRKLREVLGVTKVGDRRDVFDTYHRLIENTARKPKAFENRESHEEKEQLEADAVGLMAMARAGYDPAAFTSMFDRIAETKGKTGNFFSDIFGRTRPEARRLREMLEAVRALPAACRDGRRAAATEEFVAWQAAVLAAGSADRAEALSGVRTKAVLEPALTNEVTNLRFSPDGRYLLAQDESGVSVLSREPLAQLFRIEAPGARPAQFTPDSRRVVFHEPDMRVEVWDVEARKLETAHEPLVRKRFLQTLLSPDAKTLAGLDANLDLSLVDVATGQQVFEKKKFYTRQIAEFLFLRLLTEVMLAEEEVDEVELIHMRFSPDGRYFAAGAGSVVIASSTWLATEQGIAVAVDVPARRAVDLGGSLKKMLPGGFTFLGPDRVIGAVPGDRERSGIVTFPAGEEVERVPLNPAALSAATSGPYVFVRPVVDYAVGVMDLKTKRLFIGHKHAALDIYGDIFAVERPEGEIRLYSIEGDQLRARLAVPRTRLGNLQGLAVSPDLKWLAASGRSRGAVWDLATGARAFAVRGFRSGHFGAPGALDATFPGTDGGWVTSRLDVAAKRETAGARLEQGAAQFGPFVARLVPNKERGRHEENVTLHISSASDRQALWSRSFPKEAPKLLGVSGDGAMVLAWGLSTGAAADAVKADARLSRQVAAMASRDGALYLEVVDGRTGAPRGRLVVDTGKGSFEIRQAFAAGDWVVLADTENRALVYSLATGEQKGRVFGGYAALNAQRGLLSVQNELGSLLVYDLATMEKRETLTFPSPVSVARYSADGAALFVLTADQTAYVLDVP